MNMVHVVSSNLVAVGYDSFDQVLRIQFHSGLYDYYNVPASVHLNLMNAPSKGEYHAAFVKNSFRYKRIG